MAVNIIEGGSEEKTYENQQRSDKSAQRDTLGEIGEDAVIAPRFVYSKIGNLTNNRELIEPEEIQNEYDLFLSQMETLGQALYDSTDLSEMPDGIIDLDEYLASLGVDQEYPFQDDKYDMENWITIEEQEPSRNVATIIGDVTYNVITNINGIDYNVIHNTNKSTIGARNAG